jgi:Glycosyl hydrolases family 2
MPELDPLPSYTVRVHRLDPTLAELHIEFADLPADVEVRGRLIGPCCPGSSTIEVAYQLRKHSGTAAMYKVLIPEPVFWTADRPCVYEGPVEFRRDGKVIGTIAVSVGIRTATA